MNLDFQPSRFQGLTVLIQIHYSVGDSDSNSDIHVNEPEGDILIFMTGQDDIEKLESKLEEKIQSLEVGSCMDALVLLLHGSLPPEMQVRVFSPPPPNCRRFIVATNIAETTLTVDGVVYVIDSGYVKQRQYNPSTGMYSLDVVQISREILRSLIEIGVVTSMPRN